MKSRPELTHEARVALNQAITTCGLRSTRQRDHIFAVLLEKRDHPTVDEVYERAKSTMPQISLATVYNCLETLVNCGLVRQVNLEREPSRYCPNLAEHAHFHCTKTARVYDIPLPASIIETLKSIIPQEFDLEVVEIHFKGSQKKT
jgi:Fur family peroxide stress response transcriptional regulator